MAVRLREGIRSRTWSRTSRLQPDSPQMRCPSSTALDTHARAKRTTSWSRPIARSTNAVDYVIRMEPGVQARRRRRSDLGRGVRAGTRPGCSSQVLRRLGIAARFVSGYLIQLTPDQRPDRRTAGTGRRTSPICTRGASASSPESGLGRPRSRPRACSPPRDTSRWRPRRTRPRPPRSPAPSRRSTAEFDFEMHVDARRRPGAGDEALRGHGVGAHPHSGRSHRRRSSGPRDVRLSAGGEPTFVQLRGARRAGVEHRGAGRPRSRSIADQL